MGETEKMAGAVSRVTRDNPVRPGLWEGKAGWGLLVLQARLGPWWKEKRFPAHQALPAGMALPV